MVWIEKSKCVYRELVADECGATAIEYGLIATLIAIAAIQAMQVLGGELSMTFETISSTLSSDPGGGGADEGPVAAARATA